MSGRELPSEAKRLLLEHVDTFEQLEALVLLGGQRDRAWSIDAVASRLSIQLFVAAKALRHLTRAGLLSMTQVGNTTTFRFEAETPALTATAAALADAYTEHHLEIVRILSEKTVERARGDAVRTFADAFVLGGKKQDG